MTKKIDRNEYFIRTLSYYQSLGGVYNDIITVLIQMRGEPKFRGIPSPTLQLNMASFNCDIKSLSEAKELTLCVMACITKDEQFLSEILTLLKGDTVYYPRFKHLIGASASSYEKRQLDLSCQEISKRMTELKELIDRQNLTIADQSKLIDYLRAQNNEMEKRCAIAEQSHYEGSEFDRLLTLDTILKWIEGRKHYNYTEQVFRMLADLKDNVATNDERIKICNLENKMLDKNQTPAIFNQNFALNSNMMTGVISNPQLPIGMTPADVQELFVQYLNNLINGERQA